MDQRRHFVGAGDVLRDPASGLRIRQVNLHMLDLQIGRLKIQADDFFTPRKQALHDCASDAGAPACDDRCHLFSCPEMLS
jgi:hypothetical protein